MVEFALTIPVFVIIIVGAMDMGWLFFLRSALDSSASIGCRAGALVDPGPGDVDLAFVEAAASSSMINAFQATGGSCGNNACSTQVTTFGVTPGRSLQCQVSYEFSPLVGMTIGERTLVSSQVVRMEWQREP